MSGTVNKRMSISNTNNLEMIVTLLKLNLDLLTEGVFPIPFKGHLVFRKTSPHHTTVETGL